MHAPSLNVETPNTQKRVQRFGVGDLVRVSYGGSEPYVGHIVEAVADPTDCPGFNHCSGNSAKYRLKGRIGWVYDWQLVLLSSRPTKFSRFKKFFAWPSSTSLLRFTKEPQL